MSKPLVSFVIPAYNAADTVGRAIESALGQTHDPVEVVVVDDGSTDGTRGIAESYSPNVKVVHRENGGLPVARNMGWRAAAGEYIAFLDADDECDPERIEIQLAALGAHPDLVCLITGRKQITGDAETIRPLDCSGKLKRHSTEQLLRFARKGTGASMLVRKEVLGAVEGFDEVNPERPSGEDELFTRLSTLGGVATLWRPLYWVHASPESMRWRYDARSFPETHGRWLDPWVRGDTGALPGVIDSPGTRRAARAGLFRRCLWRAWVARDTAYADAALTRMREWARPTLWEAASAAAWKAAIALRGRRRNV